MFNKLYFWRSHHQDCGLDTPSSSLESSLQPQQTVASRGLESAVGGAVVSGVSSNEHNESPVSQTAPKIKKRRWNRYAKNLLTLFLMYEAALLIVYEINVFRNRNEDFARDIVGRYNGIQNENVHHAIEEKLSETQLPENFLNGIKFYLDNYLSGNFARYSPAADYIEIRTRGIGVSLLLKHVLHETGHRVYLNALSSQEREAFHNCLALYINRYQVKDAENALMLEEKRALKNKKNEFIDGSGDWTCHDEERLGFIQRRIIQNEAFMSPFCDFTEISPYGALMDAGDSFAWLFAVSYQPLQDKLPIEKLQSFYQAGEKEKERIFGRFFPRMNGQKQYKFRIDSPDVLGFWDNLLDYNLEVVSMPVSLTRRWLDNRKFRSRYNLSNASR